jgi:hypothetical protein
LKASWSCAAEVEKTLSGLGYKKVLVVDEDGYPLTNDRNCPIMAVNYYPDTVDADLGEGVSVS